MDGASAASPSFHTSSTRNFISTSTKTSARHIQSAASGAIRNLSHRVAPSDEAPNRHPSHSSAGAHHSHAVRHGYAFAFSIALNGFAGSARASASTEILRSMRRRIDARSRWALMPRAYGILAAFVQGKEV